MSRIVSNHLHSYPQCKFKLHSTMAANWKMETSNFYLVTLVKKTICICPDASDLKFMGINMFPNKSFLSYSNVQDEICSSCEDTEDLAYCYTLQFQILKGVLIKGGPTINLNINKRGVQIKEGVWTIFSVKSGKLLLHWTKSERQIKLILLSHSQGLFKYMYLKPPWSSYN